MSRIHAYELDDGTVVVVLVSRTYFVYHPSQSITSICWSCVLESPMIEPVDITPEANTYELDSNPEPNAAR